MVALSHQSAMARRAALIDYGKFFLLAGLAVWLLTLRTHGLGYHWQWYRVPRFLFTTEGGVWAAGPLLQGLLVTLEISALALVCTLILGLTAALFRLSASFTARTLARGYLELIRNTPLLIQIFFIYFVLSPILEIGAFASAVLALSLFEGAQRGHSRPAVSGRTGVLFFRFIRLIRNSSYHNHPTWTKLVDF